MLPFLACWSFATQQKDYKHWLMSRWGDLERREGVAVERLYLYVLYGYLFKDCFVGMDTIYWAHHTVCWMIIFAFCYVDMAPTFVMGSMFLELGSATQTILFLYGDHASACVVHVLGMTLSNAFAGHLVLLYARDGLGDGLVRYVLSSLTIVLIVARQYTVFTNWDRFNTGELEQALFIFAK